MKEWIVATFKDDPQQRLHIAVCEKGNSKKIIAITGYAGAPDEEDSIDNAVLIASAPIVREALENLVREIISKNLQHQIGVDVFLATTALSISRREDVRHLELIEG